MRSLRRKRRSRKPDCRRNWRPAWAKAGDRAPLKRCATPAARPEEPMFRKLLAGAALGASFFVLVAPAGAQQTVDDLVAKHVAARGGLAALRAVQNITAAGTLYIPGFDVTLAYRQYYA